MSECDELRRLRERAEKAEARVKALEGLLTPNALNFSYDPGTEGHRILADVFRELRRRAGLDKLAEEPPPWERGGTCERCGAPYPTNVEHHCPELHKPSPAADAPRLVCACGYTTSESATTGRVCPQCGGDLSRLDDGNLPPVPDEPRRRPAKEDGGFDMTDWKPPRGQRCGNCRCWDADRECSGQGDCYLNIVPVMSSLKDWCGHWRGNAEVRCGECRWWNPVPTVDAFRCPRFSTDPLDDYLPHAMPHTDAFACTRFESKED